MATETATCRCGRFHVQVGNAIVTFLHCDHCPPEHEGGWIAALDEWCHAHVKYAGIWWRHPIGSLCWLLYRPLCNYRERRLLSGSEGAASAASLRNLPAPNPPSVIDGNE